MNTTIVVPDELLHAADLHAVRVGKSRSQVFADALADYLERHEANDVTEAMDRVVGEVGQQARSGWQDAAARRALEGIEW